MANACRNLKMIKEIVAISKIIKEMREADVKDSQGNTVIQKGLKVRHKKSGLEYTVQDVQKDGDKVKLSLAVPEMPRVDVTKTTKTVMTEKDNEPSLDDLIGALDTKKEVPPEQETIFVVDEKDFEREYEVK